MKVLLMDKSSETSGQIEQSFADNSQFKFSRAKDFSEINKRLEQNKPDCIICDPIDDRFEVKGAYCGPILSKIGASFPDTTIIVLADISLCDCPMSSPACNASYFLDKKGELDKIPEILRDLESKINNSREHQRISLSETFSLVYGSDNIAIDVIDLSVNGIGFMSSEKIAVGIQVSIVISDSEKFAETVIEAKILRCEPGSEENTYMVGALFLNEDILYIDDIHKLIVSTR